MENKLADVVLCEKKHFPKINEIIRPNQKILKINTPLLKIYISVILNKYFSEGFVTLVKSSSVNNLSKYVFLINHRLN